MDKTYKCVIIDDEQSAVELISEYLNMLSGDFQIVRYTDPMEAAVEFVGPKPVDFLFIDISMYVSGLDIARKFRSQIRFLIFISGYSRFAVDAFTVGADHFLLKPLSFQRFLDSLNQVLKRNQQSEFSPLPL